MASDTEAVDTDVIPPESKPKLKDWMRSISGQIRYLSTGDRAGLRRMVLTNSHAANGTVAKLLVAAKVPARVQEDDFDRWRLIAYVAATLSGTGAVQAHADGRQLGTALQKVFNPKSENRLMRLLATRGDALHDQVRHVARLLAQKGEQPVNLCTLYHLVGDDDAKADRARIDIARDYYAAAARSEKGDNSDD